MLTSPIQYLAYTTILSYNLTTLFEWDTFMCCFHGCYWRSRPVAVSMWWCLSPSPLPQCGLCGKASRGHACGSLYTRMLRWPNMMWTSGIVASRAGMTSCDLAWWLLVLGRLQNARVVAGPTVAVISSSTTIDRTNSFFTNHRVSKRAVKYIFGALKEKSKQGSRETVGNS